MKQNCKFSIIIPVLNEGKEINSLIRSLERNKDCEIVVVDGAKNKNTLKKIKEKVVKICSSKGRARQMNAGAKRAKGKYLVFLHADTELPKDALRSIQKVRIKFPAGSYDQGYRT